MKKGYYVFLGNGDYHPSLLKTKDWIPSWNLQEWKAFVDKLLSLPINTLMIYLNGHSLPYSSIYYPELMDLSHPNNQQEFLKELFVYIKSRGLQLIAVITTTGHAAKFSELYKTAQIEVSQEKILIENTLVSFPEHLRKDKLSKKEGAAQLGYGVLCHNKKEAKQYAINIISELIHLYGDYFDAIALHPPEFVYPCVCNACKIQFNASGNRSIDWGNLEKRRAFFIKSYFAFQRDLLFPQIKRYLPRCTHLTFTIPWIFEDFFTEIVPFISKETTLIEWDYNLNFDRIASLKLRLCNYMSFGHALWFMPTAGFSFSNKQSTEEQIAAVKHQLNIAKETGVQGIIHFLGPLESKFLVETRVRVLSTSH